MLTPTMSGLASGLRSVVWKMAPPTPKATPTSTAEHGARAACSPSGCSVAPGISVPVEDPDEVGDRDGVVAAAARARRRRRPARRRGPRARRRVRRTGRAARTAHDVQGVRPWTLGGSVARGRPSGHGSQRPHPAAADQREEDRDADDGGHDADLHLGRAAARPGRPCRRATTSTAPYAHAERQHAGGSRGRRGRVRRAGTTRPTKAIGPASAVAAPASSTTASADDEAVARRRGGRGRGPGRRRAPGR